jgi:hypothetical protein
MWPPRRRLIVAYALQIRPDKASGAQLTWMATRRRVVKSFAATEVWFLIALKPIHPGHVGSYAERFLSLSFQTNISDHLIISPKPTRGAEH